MISPVKQVNMIRCFGTDKCFGGVPKARSSCAFVTRPPTAVTMVTMPVTGIFVSGLKFVCSRCNCSQALCLTR